MNRRELLMLSAGAVRVRAAAATPGWASPEFDVPRLELVLELVVTCSRPEAPGPETLSKDGQRKSIWPIVGGKFVGQDVRGVVVPGGGDFPVVRPDGVTVIDALYRLLTEDGITILIHNRGLSIGADEPGGRPRYRLSPEFTAPRGKYDWLNKGVFIANLTTNVPSDRRLARSENENDRLIHVYRLA
jgi:hypothetical protein